MAAWIHGWSSEPLSVLVVLLLLLLPSGRFLSPRWRLSGRATMAMAALWGVARAFDPGPLPDPEQIAKPVGIDGATDELDIPPDAFNPHLDLDAEAGDAA